jgi:hypothetical protein
VKITAPNQTRLCRVPKSIGASTTTNALATRFGESIPPLTRLDPEEQGPHPEREDVPAQAKRPGGATQRERKHLNGDADQRKSGDCVCVIHEVLDLHGHGHRERDEHQPDDDARTTQSLRIPEHRTHRPIQDTVRFRLHRNVWEGRATARDPTKETVRPARTSGREAPLVHQVASYAKSLRSRGWRAQPLVAKLSECRFPTTTGSPQQRSAPTERVLA